jgi:hypothetical protein
MRHAILSWAVRSACVNMFNMYQLNDGEFFSLCELGAILFRRVSCHYRRPMYLCYFKYIWDSTLSANHDIWGYTPDTEGIHFTMGNCVFEHWSFDYRCSYILWEEISHCNHEYLVTNVQIGMSYTEVICLLCPKVFAFLLGMMSVILIRELSI